ncbi:MAG TPA: hypothetical protein VFN97_03750 [Actinospica sp.]|nr:hypothetical protein [Actinospica sp.]
MTTPQITRRGLLTAAVLVAAVPGTAAAAPAKPAPAAAKAAPAAPSHHPRSTGVRTDVTGSEGNASVTVSVMPVQDVTAIDYTITNVGVIADTFTVWTTDLDNGRQSRKLYFNLDAGDSDSAEVYGRLNHSFQVNVCQSDGTCFTVGPVGPAAQIGGPARGLTARPGQVAPTPQR